MKTLIDKLLYATILLGFCLNIAQADIPLLLPYSGSVVVDGESFNGQGEFKFAIINGDCVASLPSCASLWSNDNSSNQGSEPNAAVQVTVNQGKYALKLGNINIANMLAIPQQTFSGSSNTYLRVWFNDGVTGFQQLTPDRQLISVPYAYVAGAFAPGAISTGQGLTLTGNQIGIDAELLDKINNAAAKATVAGNGISVNTDANGTQIISLDMANNANNIIVDSNITSLSTNKLVGSISENQIANSAVSNNKIANLAVTSDKIASAAIGAIHIVGNAIGSGHIVNGAVQLDDLADNSVNSAKVALNSLTANDLAADSVGLSEIGTGAVASDEIVDGSISVSDIDTASVQARVDGTCNVGSAVTAIASDGSVTCQQNFVKTRSHVTFSSEQIVNNAEEINLLTMTFSGLPATAGRIYAQLTTTCLVTPTGLPNNLAWFRFAMLNTATGSVNWGAEANAPGYRSYDNISNFVLVDPSAQRIFETGGNQTMTIRVRVRSDNAQVKCFRGELSAVFYAL
ncbi:MAG: hypothetical protein OEY38_21350 [Gammaproteobacteria bacterium]|nr:hypothetical protein [Gammaproteobacteria bacterium]